MEKVLPLVSIVIVNYNGRRWLTDCLRSLSLLAYPRNRLQVIMVDNGSKDDSVRLARKLFPKIHIVRSDRNNYCRANNLGVKAAKGKYVAFLNNDTRVDKNWIKELVKVIDRDEKIGGVGGKIYFMDGKLNSTGHMELPDFYWTDRGFAEKEKGQYDTQEEMKSITNSASLYRKKCLTDVGLFDEDFNMYLEDVDLGIRLRQKSWKIVYCPKSIVHHQVHGTATRDQVFLGVEKNRLLLLAKHFPEKLSDALLGRGYFSNPKEHPKAPGLADVMPRIVSKLRKHHGGITMRKVLPTLFLSLQKETNLRVHNLIQDANYEKGRADGKDKELWERSREIEVRTEKLAQAAQLEKELRFRQAALEQEIRDREGEGKRLKGELDAKERELKKQQGELEARSAKLIQYVTIETELRDKQALLEKDLAAQQFLFEEERKKREALENTVKVREDEGQRLKGELEEKEKELKKQFHELETQSGQVAQYVLVEKELRAQQALWETNLGAQRALLEEEKKTCRFLQDTLHDRDEAAGHIKAELERKDEELTKRLREIDARAGKLAQHELLEKEFRAQQGLWENSLTSYQNSFEEEKKVRSALEEAAQVQKEEMGRLKTELEAKGKELGEQGRELEARAGRVAQYEQCEKDLRARQESLEVAIQAREEEIVQLKTQCENGEREFWSQQTAWEEKFDVQQASLIEGQAAIKILEKEGEVLNENLIRIIKSRDVLQKQSNDFYASRSFRYLIGPVWRTLNRMKQWQQSILSFGKKPPKVKDFREQVLFIKPQRISVNEAKWKIHEFKVQNPNVRVAALANLTQEDYEKIFPDPDLLFDEKFFYSPKIKKFNGFEKLKFLFKIRKRKLWKAIILVSAPAYRGYKLALILAILTGAKKVEIQRVQEGTDVRGVSITKEFLGIETFKDMLLLPFRVLLIVAVVLWFVVFIAGGIQCRKFFYQFRRAGH